MGWTATVPWWAWMLAGVGVQDVLALVVMYRMGYVIDWGAWRTWWDRT